MSDTDPNEPSGEDPAAADTNANPDTGQIVHNVDALDKIQSFAQSELPRVRKRAQAWTTGVTAVTGVLATAGLVKGPATFADISDARLGLGLGARDIVVILLAVGGAALATSVWQSYVAAYGSPLSADPIERLIENPSQYSGNAAEA